MASGTFTSESKHHLKQQIHNEIQSINITIFHFSLGVSLERRKKKGVGVGGGVGNMLASVVI